MTWLVEIDVRLFRAIHQALFATPAGSVLAAIQLAGREGMILLIAIATLFAPRGRRVAVAARLATTVLLASGTCEVLKHIVSEPRPASYVPEALSSAFYFVAADGDVVRHARSWPSGHTTAVFAFAMALVLLKAPRRAIAGGFLVAALTGLGRVSLGAHFPLDVVAGACVGILVAWAVHAPLGALERRLARVPLDAGAPAPPVPVTVTDKPAAGSAPLLP